MVRQFFGSSDVDVSTKRFLEPLSEEHADFCAMSVYAQIEVKSGKNEAKILDVIGGHRTF